MKRSPHRRHLAALVLTLTAILGIVGCSSSDAESAPNDGTPATVGATATNQVETQPAATSTTGTTRASSTATAAPATSTPSSSTATPTARATSVPPTASPPGPASGPSGEIRIAVRGIGPINAFFFNGGGGSIHFEFGTMENLFWEMDGDGMAPLLAEGWSVDPAGAKATVKIREGVPWNPPRGQEHLDLGVLNAGEIALWMNLANLATNPNSLHFNGGDYASFYGEARALDDQTLEIDLSSPIYFALPLLSQFAGIGGGGRNGPTYVRGIETMGEEWADSNVVGTGPYVIGDCLENDRCEFHALPEHWRQTAPTAQVTAIAVDFDQIYPMLKNGVLDVSIQHHYGSVKDALDTGLQYLDVTEGMYIGQSVAWPGNLWEEFHAITGEPLSPWDSPAYDRDWPWIGDPWQESHPDKVRYVDDDNPAGMTDMEQARLVRLALSVALDREAIVEEALQGLGIPLYSEYMGPEYEGWDPNRTTAVWSYDGQQLEPSGSAQGIRWEFEDGNLEEADRLLTLAGFPLVNGERRGFEIGLRVNVGGFGEVGDASFFGTDLVNETWAKLGIVVLDEPEDSVSEYFGIISPRMRKREQFFPVFKNGDMPSNVIPIDYPYAAFDTSLTRGGGAIGFESPYLAQQVQRILGERDAEIRAAEHIEVADYMLYWQLYSGVFQAKKGFVSSQRVKEIGGPICYQCPWAGHPEFIILKDQ